jgi:asparagine synthase (glutamine-hydrolysing)
MCGIAGIWRAKSQPIDDVAAIARGMAHTLVRRGPDGEGVWVDDRSGLALAHRRLAIQDVSPAAAQPMQDAQQRSTLVFNGEIYNYQELRARLALEGFKPLTNRGAAPYSDTAVLLQMLQHWGVDYTCVHALGMFALAWWDSTHQILYLVRDRMGKKPLYFAHGAWGMAFASQPRALWVVPELQPQLHPEGLVNYLHLGFAPVHQTLLSGIQVVEPGQIQQWALRDGLPVCIESYRYWHLGSVAAHGLANRIHSLPQACETLRPLLLSAVRHRVQADVAVGAYLSGGVDSALVVAAMQAVGSVQGGPTRTFSMGFDDPAYDEAPQAMAIAQHLGTQHTQWRMNGADALAMLNQIPDILDEPMADASIFPTTFLSLHAQSHVGVVLTGDGGDEAFGGYMRYRQAQGWLGQLQRLPWGLRYGLAQCLQHTPNRIWDRLGQLLPQAKMPTQFAIKVNKLAGWLKQKNPAEQSQIFLALWPAHSLPRAHWDDGEFSAPQGLSPSEVLQWWEMRHYLPGDLLTKMDRATMWASLEARSPLLDHRIIELAWCLAPALKAMGGTPKRVLRTLLSEVLPADLVYGPKRGFSVPLDAWLRGALREPSRELLESWCARGWSESSSWPVLPQRHEVMKTWSAQQAGAVGLADRIWALMQLELWIQRWRP